MSEKTCVLSAKYSRQSLTKDFPPVFNIVFRYCFSNYTLGHPLIRDILLNVFWKIPQAGGPIL